MHLTYFMRDLHAGCNYQVSALFHLAEGPTELRMVTRPPSVLLTASWIVVAGILQLLGKFRDEETRKFVSSTSSDVRLKILSPKISVICDAYLIRMDIFQLAFVSHSIPCVYPLP